MIERVEKIRKNIGNDYFIMLKIKCRESFDDSFTEEEFISYCKLTEKAGIDILSFHLVIISNLMLKNINVNFFILKKLLKLLKMLNSGYVNWRN